MPENLPKISVVMPAYNHERYVAESIQSVLGQTFSDLELIIIDDGSSDGTAAVIASFADSRIAYHHQENAGAHVALNKGLSLARGDYLAILNSDDVWAPERLARLVELAGETGRSFLFSAVEHIDAKSRTLAADDPRKTGYEEVVDFCRDGDLLQILLLGNYALTSSNFFMIRSVFELVGPFSAYRYVHDYDFLLRVLKICGREKVGFVPERLIKYRRHGRNTITENQGLVSLETCRILAEHLPGFMQCDVDRRFAESVFAPLVLRLGMGAASITSTRSWKLTAPLRWAAEAFRLPPRSVS